MISETTGPTLRDDEPGVALRLRPAPLFQRLWFRLLPILVAVVAVALLVSANPSLPFERLVTLEGAMGSKADFFDDEQVKEILLRHHLRVDVTREGSRDAATGNFASLDFIFPSGQPAAEVAISRLRRDGKPHYTRHQPFVSPIVLATFRNYAETLRDAGVATPQVSAGSDRPYYYNLDMQGFLNLTRAQKSWNDLNSRAHGFSNANKILAQTSDVCMSNGAATYLGMLSYVIRGDIPKNEQEAVDLATEIKPLLRGQGMFASAPEIYFTPEGRRTVPIIVLYEHQYLAYQLRYRERAGAVDDDRVLLYPSTEFQTQPELIALNDNASRLGNLLTNDPDLQRRAPELGFRVIDPGQQNSSERLFRFLHEHGVPAPSTASDTRAVLPIVPLLETMISVVGDCPRQAG